MSEVEELLSQLEVQNQQLQAIMLQKQTLMIQGKEIEKALEELATAGDKEIYKSVGPILVRTGKAEVTKELGDTKEDIDLKLVTLEKQEKRLKDKIREHQERFQKMLPKTGEAG